MSDRLQETTRERPDGPRRLIEGAVRATRNHPPAKPAPTPPPPPKKAGH